jgi:hypothetical protein
MKQNLMAPTVRTHNDIGGYGFARLSPSIIEVASDKTEAENSFRCTNRLNRNK